MGLSQLKTRDGTGIEAGRRPARPLGHHHHGSHVHAWERALSRRHFLGGVAGATAAVLGAGLLGPGRAYAAADPRPIPGGLDFDGKVFHVLAPGTPMGALDDDPATITDLSGFVGLAYVSGRVTRTDTRTGQTLALPFIESDMRFMQGTYRGLDGQTYQGTFGFI